MTKNKTSMKQLDQFSRYQLHKQPMIDNLHFEGFQQNNYQHYAQRIFQINSDSLRWFMLYFAMGTGKTALALNILKQNYGEFVIVGNEVSQKAFMDDMPKLEMPKENFKFITLQKASTMTKIELVDFFIHKYIIIDEFQKLYSQTGLNSWGETMKFVFSKTLKWSKVLCLSGTIFNSSINELEYVMDIFGLPPDEKILAQHTISWAISDPKFMPRKNQIGFPENKQLIKKFQLVRCEMSKEQYKEYIASETQQETLLQTYKFLLPKYYYDGEKHFAKEILRDTLVSKESLKKHSPIAYFFINKMQEILKQTDLKKSVAYIENINTQFGLLQYIEILRVNGFLEYGHRATSKTLCSVCGKELQDHGNSSKSHFRPATFMIYANQTSPIQREAQKEIFNSYNNRHGEIVCLYLLTSIATTGLSLMCVSNSFILDNIPEISLFEQIIARSVRYKSHVDLPQEKRYVNIYCLAISAPGLSKATKHEQKWMEIYEENEKIENLYSKIKENCFNAEILLEKKKHVKVSDQFLEIFQYQVQKQIRQFIKQIDVKAIPTKELIAILRNDLLIPFGFTLSDFNDEFLISQIQLSFTVLDGVCYGNENWINYTNMARQRIQQYPKLDFSQYDEIDVEKRTSDNVLSYIDSTTNTNTLRYYIKTFMQQNVNVLSEFLKKNMLCCFMIWENIVYMENDENNYLENHKNLFSKIYDKDIHYVVSHKNQLIRDHHIIGYYQGNDIFQKEKRAIKAVNKQIDENMLMCFYLTNQMPVFKISKNMQIRDCIIQQPIFEEIFQDEKFVKQKEYEKQIQQFKCRYIQYYAFMTDTLQGPGFLIQRDD